MKKTFSTIAAFCIGLLVSISIYACADDFKDPSLMGSEELESLKEVVMKYNEKVEKLPEEVSTLKTIVEQQKVQIAELTENVALSGKRELITGFSQTYQEFDKDSYSFEYDNDGRITRITFRGGDGYSATSHIISYTDTECIISERDGGGVVTIATTSNDIATINMLIWANILNEFL